MKKINDILKQAGIPLYGICSFDGDNLIECRNKKLLPENAKSIIMTAFPYRLPDEFYEGRNVSRYAVVCDYHTVLKKYLDEAVELFKEEFPQNNFVSFTDNSPIYEVQSAVKAGLGVRGDNGLLITQEYGSWVFLGEIVTDLELECSDLSGECIHCGKCKEVCDVVCGDKKENCLSAITQKKGELTDEQKDRIKKSGCAWGCDLCQEVCPMNENKKITTVKEFSEHNRAGVFAGDSLENRAYAWRGQAVIDRNINLLGKEKQNEV